MAELRRPCSSSSRKKVLVAEKIGDVLLTVFFCDLRELLPSLSCASLLSNGSGSRCRSSSSSSENSARLHTCDDACTQQEDCKACTVKLCICTHASSRRLHCFSLEKRQTRKKFFLLHRWSSDTEAKGGFLSKPITPTRHTELFPTSSLRSQPEE